MGSKELHVLEWAPKSYWSGLQRVKAVSTIAESEKNTGTNFFERNDFIMIFYDDSNSEKNFGRTEMRFSSRFIFLERFQRIPLAFRSNLSTRESTVTWKIKGNPLKTTQKLKSW